MGASYLSSVRKDLRFQGGFQLGSDCYALNSSWTQFDTIVDPKKVVLPIVDSLRDHNGKYIRLGLSFSAAQNRFYPSFFEAPFSKNDEGAFHVSGVTYFDTISNTYHVGHPERFKDSIHDNQYIRMSLDSCIVAGDGKIDLLAEMPHIDLESYGSFKHKVIPDSTYFDLMLSLNFFINDKMMKMMGDTIRNANNEGVDLLTFNKRKYLTQFLGRKEAQKLFVQLLEDGQVKRVPEKFRKTLVFNDLKMVWNDQTRSYITAGNIGLSNILDIPLNKYCKGYVEIEKRKTGNRFNIYIEAAPNKWYFFAYNDYVLQVLSSDDNFNAEFLAVKEKKRIKKGKGKLRDYEYVLTTKDVVMKFINKMERARQ